MICPLPRPMPGDVVRLTAPWSIAAAGALGVIDGTVGQPPAELHITFNASAFRGRRILGADFVSCSGGPGTMFLPAERLVPTGETIRQRFWRWKDAPRKDGGEDYYLDVPLWEWDGIQGAEIVRHNTDEETTE